MSDVNKLEFHPDFEPTKVDPNQITLPIELKNYKDEVIAHISKHWKNTDRYYGSVNHHTIDNYGYGYDSFSECLTAVFGYLYSQMQDYRKQAEEYSEVRSALKKALK